MRPEPLGPCSKGSPSNQATVLLLQERHTVAANPTSLPHAVEAVARPWQPQQGTETKPVACWIGRASLLFWDPIGVLSPSESLLFGRARSR